MQCPKCGGESFVRDTRVNQRQKRRRRECKECGERFLTIEKTITPEKDLPSVIKSDGRSEPFNGHKLHDSLKLALVKRPFDSEAFENLEQRIREQVLRKSATEIHSRDVGLIVMRELRKLDSVAYIRFASVYRDFKDLGAFQDEVTRITAAKKKKKAQGASNQMNFFDTTAKTKSDNEH